MDAKIKVRGNRSENKSKIRKKKRKVEHNSKIQGRHIGMLFDTKQSFPLGTLNMKFSDIKKA